MGLLLGMRCSGNPLQPVPRDRHGRSFIYRPVLRWRVLAIWISPLGMRGTARATPG